MPFMNSARSSFGAQGRKNTPWRAFVFSSYTFTNAGISGINGPTLAQCRTAYAATSWANTYLNMTTQGIQRWTVPSSGWYNITAAGAKGGDYSSYIGGSGRVISGKVYLFGNETINIVVGQMGSSSYGSGAGGGGASFVYRGSDTSTSESNLLFAAAGGSGALQGGSPVSGDTAPASTDPTYGKSGGSSNSFSTSFGLASSGAGGTLNPHNNYGGGPGAGFFGQGPEPRQTAGNQTGGGYSGKSASSGWLGGARYSEGGEGGFGGGGSAANNCGGTGGGAGYNGGSGQTCYCVSGAGGSKWGSSVSNGQFLGTNGGHGYVTIAKA